MPEAIEITTFRLVRGSNLGNFIVANHDVDAWLLLQPGFKGRWIAERDDQVIVDTLLWTSADEALDAAGRLMAELRDSPVHALIQQGSVSWTVCKVRHRLRGRQGGF